jgi:hypothetical protein
MPKCETCQDTGNCPCGATDCGPKPCPDCYCGSCGEAGKSLVGPGKLICEECAKAEREARAEDAWDDRANRGQR